MVKILPYAPGIVASIFNQKPSRAFRYAQMACLVVITPFAHIAHFFVAAARETANACSSLTHRLCKATRNVRIRLWIVFIRTCPGTRDKLSSLSVTGFNNNRMTNNFKRAVIDTFVADYLNTLIEYYRMHQRLDLLTLLGLPHQATLDRDKAWGQLMNLFDRLPILTAFLADVPLSTVLSRQCINSSIIHTDNATVALRKALFSSKELNQSVPKDFFTGLESKTNPSEIQNYLHAHKQALAKFKFISLSNMEYRVVPPGIRLFPNLTMLSMQTTSQCLIIPDKAFDGLTSLQVLRLYNSNIPRIPPKCFDKLSSLRQLTLDNTGLTTLPQDVCALLGNLEESLHHSQ
jgi:hypothetical protein